jgi:hypothetical protein
MYPQIYVHIVIRIEYFTLMGSPPVHDSIMLTYELIHILLLDYKFALSEDNISSMIYETGSLHNRRVGFMRSTKNLFFQALTGKLWPKLKRSVML